MQHIRKGIILAGGSGNKAMILVFGPTLVQGGTITVRLCRPAGQDAVYVDIETTGMPSDAAYRINLPGYLSRTVTGAGEGFRLEPVRVEKTTSATASS